MQSGLHRTYGFPKNPDLHLQSKYIPSGVQSAFSPQGLPSHGLGSTVTTMGVCSVVITEVDGILSVAVES